MVKEKSIAELKDQLGKCAEERNTILNAIKADLIIGQWGSLEIYIDKRMQATDDAIRLTVSGYFDIMKGHDNSFAIGSLK